MRTTTVTPGAAVAVALAVVYVVWGSTYLGIRVVVQAGLPPMLSMGVRFLLAAALLALILAARGGWSRLRLPTRPLAATCLVGLLLLVGGNGLVAVAEQTVPSALAALLVATTPLWLVLFRSATGDRPRWATWLGTAVGFGGVAVLARPDAHPGGLEWAGTGLVVVATLLWAIGSFASGRMPMPVDPFVAAVWQMLAGGVGLVVAGAARGEAAGVDLAAVPARGWVALAYLVVFGSLLAYTAYYWLLRHAPISLVSTYAYVNPLVAVLLGWLVLAEPVTATVLAGGGLAVVGVLLVVSTERPGRRTAPVAAQIGPPDGVVVDGVVVVDGEPPDLPKSPVRA